MKQTFIILSATLLFLSCSTSKYQQSTPVYAVPKGKVNKQSFLESTGATVDHMKKHVSVDTGCSVDKITVISMAEELGNGIYNLDVCGVKMKYRRTGSVFFKDGEKPSGM